MRAEVTRHTLAEIAENYEAAMAWVDSVGFPTERGRHTVYRKTITRLREQFPAIGWGDLTDDAYRDQVCAALLESRELVSIYRGLSGLDNPDALPNLRHYIKGPELSAHERAETSSNRPRNLGFELYLNALFAYAGLVPRYDTKADLLFSSDRLHVFVEAKRPMTEQAVHASVCEAIKQLTHRFTPEEEFDQAGIVALDLSKVINPKNLVMPVRDEEHLYDLMQAEDLLQTRRLYPTVAKNVKPGVVGILLHYRLLANFQPSGDLNTVKWLGWIPFLEDPRLEDVFKRVAGVVQLIC